MANLILGSSSPRRRQLMNEITDKFEIVNSDFDENLIKSRINDPELLVRLLSINKSIEISLKTKNKYVLSCDTLVSFQNEILNKPLTKDKAYEYLKKLNNNTHEVLTSFAISINGVVIYSEIVTSKLFIFKMNDDMINRYIETLSPLDKAGGYGVQDSEYIKCKYDSENDYHNIMGFPIDNIKNALKLLKII